MFTFILLFPPRPTNQESRDFLARAELEVKAAEMTRNAKLTELRYADKTRLQKHRQHRIQVLREEGLSRWLGLFFVLK